MKPKIIFTDRCLTYDTHTMERPLRVSNAHNVLKQREYEFITPDPITEELLSVHEEEYIKEIKGGLINDPDTPGDKFMYEYAMLAAGAAVVAAKVQGFSLMRPPGHHAGRTGAALGAYTRGFCYLNNVAIAVKYLDKPTLILDIDGHHGNGTQEIFLGDNKVNYISLHRHPFYPGTGYYSEANCFNFPLKAECGGEAYLRTLDKALKIIDLNKIEVVAVSAGFDAFRGDLASLGLTEKVFGEIGKKIAALNKYTFFVLEGGYVGDNIGKGTDELLKHFYV
jgi:acetoin utilization deacetylase AcuC-like enzyme